MCAKIKEKIDASIEGKLRALYELQIIDSKIDRIRTVRGELPLEVQDLEDSVAGLETRVTNLSQELKELEEQVVEKTQAIKDYSANIKKYEAQQGKVRNNREYDAITKEIEFQNLEIQLAEKRLKENKFAIEQKSDIVEKSEHDFSERKKDLKLKKSELDEIISETEKEEKELIKASEKACEGIEDDIGECRKIIQQQCKETNIKNFADELPNDIVLLTKRPEQARHHDINRHQCCRQKTDITREQAEA